MSADRDAYRLTPEDEAQIVGRLAETVARFRCDTEHHGGRWLPTDAMLPTLERIGWHSIGCGSYDLRDVELEWIEARAREALGLQVDHTRSVASTVALMAAAERYEVAR